MLTRRVAVESNGQLCLRASPSLSANHARLSAGSRGGIDASMRLYLRTRAIAPSASPLPPFLQQPFPPAAAPLAGS